MPCYGKCMRQNLWFIEQYRLTFRGNNRHETAIQAGGISGHKIQTGTYFNQKKLTTQNKTNRRLLVSKCAWENSLHNVVTLTLHFTTLLTSNKKANRCLHKPRFKTGMKLLQTKEIPQERPPTQHNYLENNYALLYYVTSELFTHYILPMDLVVKINVLELI